jgi:hypothetical protein
MGPQKEALDEDISITKRYPPDDLKKWLTEEDFKRWKNGNNEMKERKPDVDRKEDTKGMPRKEQLAIFRLRTGYTSANHGPKMEGVTIVLPLLRKDKNFKHFLFFSWLSF